MLGLKVMAWVMVEVFTTVTNYRYLDRGEKGQRHTSETHGLLPDFSATHPIRYHYTDRSESLRSQSRALYEIARLI